MTMKCNKRCFVEIFMEKVKRSFIHESEKNAVTFQPDDVLAFALTCNKSYFVETLIGEVLRMYIHGIKRNVVIFQANYNEVQ